MKPNSNTVLIIIVTLIVAAVAYYFFFTGTGNQPPLTSSGSSNLSQSQFQNLVNELSISFDTGIFSDARFNALVDLTTQISPESAGRLDPFAPVSPVQATPANQ